MTNFITHNPRKILVVTCDLPSHTYAAAKLARLLQSAGHSIRLAAPEGPAFRRIKEEIKGTGVQCISVGAVTTKKHMNERPVTNPHAWETILASLRNPFPMAEACNAMFDEQEGMYEPLKREIQSGSYDLVMPIHSVVATVCDAVEATTFGSTPVVMFSSLPYDPGMCLGDLEAWYMPRSLTTFPHVSTYSATPPRNPFLFLSRLFWQVLDALLTARAWRRSAHANNVRRARRGLSPTPNGFLGYLQKVPTVTFGGIWPYLDANSKVAPHVTTVGSFDVAPLPLSGKLLDWVDQIAGAGLIYASFGTGTELSRDEAFTIVNSLLTNSKHLPVLVALRASEQRRLRSAFDEAVGSEPTAISNSHLEYLDGKLRIQEDVPQSSLLKSGKVRLFLSHMGMGGFVEGCRGGAPFVAYPSGCDQWFNAQRAVDARIAVLAPYGLHGLREQVEQVLDDHEMQARAKNMAKHMADIRGEERVLDLVDQVTKPDVGIKTTTVTGAMAIDQAKGDVFKRGERRPLRALAA